MIATRALLPATKCVLTLWFGWACGGRSSVDGPAPSAVAGNCAWTPAAEVGGAGGAGPGSDDGSSFGGDAGGLNTIDGSTPARDCLACALSACSNDLAACVASPSCTDGLWCSATSCWDPSNTDCVMGCFANPVGAIQALALWSCVSDTCGADCIAGLALDDSS